MADLVKGNDDDFFAQTTQFHAFVSAKPSEWGFTQADVDGLNAENTTFGSSLNDYTTKDTAARAARQKKDLARDVAEVIFRWMAKQFNNRQNVTNADRIAAGLPPYGEASTGKTPDFSQPPVLLVEQAGVHEHRIRFFMPTENANSTKKPDNVDGAKLFVKIGGESSTSLKEYALMTYDRKQPYSYTHEAEDVGKTAHYIGVWATDDDEQGTQSEVFSLVIT